MLRGSYKPAELMVKLRQVDILHCQGATIAGAADWRERGNLLPLTHGVWRDEDLSAQAAEGVGEGERASATCCLRSDAGQANPVLGRQGKLLSFSRLRHD